MQSCCFGSLWYCTSDDRAYLRGEGGFNDGLCGTDGVCGLCPCSCNGEPGCPQLYDVCPLDTENDADSDGICGDVDSCPADPANDVDGDGICNSNDLCPLDRNNDRDSDGICGDEDSCSIDPENDADGDGICGDLDPCNDLTREGDCPSTEAPTTTGPLSNLLVDLSQDAWIGIGVAAAVLLIIIIVIIVVIVRKQAESKRQNNLAVGPTTYTGNYGAGRGGVFSPSAGVEVEVDDDFDDNDQIPMKKRVSKRLAKSPSKASSSSEWTYVPYADWQIIFIVV